MSGELKCSKHGYKSAAYICTHQNCVQNLLCFACVAFHDGQHNNRLLILNETFTNEDSLLNIVKNKQFGLIDQIASILKNKEQTIEKTVNDINSCFESIIEDTLATLQEFKREIIFEFRNSINKDSGLDNEKLESTLKQLRETKLEDENNILITVKKIQTLEDEVLPFSSNILQTTKPANFESSIQKYQMILSSFPKEFSKRLKSILSEMYTLKPYSNEQFNDLVRSSFSSSYSLTSLKDLTITSPLKLESDTFHRFDHVLIDHGGVLTVEPWNGFKGGKLILICNSITIRSKGAIDVSSSGYRGGLPCSNSSPNQSNSGESYIGKGTASREFNFGGGGGGPQDGSFGGIGGGGGGYGAPGQDAKPNTEGDGKKEGGKGGIPYGDEEMTVIYMGSGGGAGAPYCNGNGKGKGGNGGGLLVIIAKEFHNEGKVLSNGGNGEDAQIDSYGSGGGGGSGGSIFVSALLIDNRGEISANGGKGGEWGKNSSFPGIGSDGGNGGVGRVKLLKDFGKGKKVNIYGLNFNDK